MLINGYIGVSNILIIHTDKIINQYKRKGFKPFRYIYVYITVILF